MLLTVGLSYNVKSFWWTLDWELRGTSFLNRVAPCPVHHTDKHTLSSLSAPTTCRVAFPNMNSGFLPPSVWLIHTSLHPNEACHDSCSLGWWAPLHLPSSPVPQCLYYGRAGDWTHMLASPIYFNKLDWKDWNWAFELNDTRAQQGKNLRAPPPPHLWTWSCLKSHSPPPSAAFQDTAVALVRKTMLSRQMSWARFSQWWLK